MNDIDEWTRRFLAEEPPRSKSLVMSIFGDTVAAHGGSIWLGSLIELLAPLGVNDRLLRTSVFRLAQEGWLAARRDGRRSAYAIAPEAWARFERARRRIYAPLALHWDGGWTVVIGVAGVDPARRAALRKELLWEGYGLIAPGIAGHPAADPQVLEEILQRTDVQNKVYVCRTTALAGVSQRPLRELVDDGWDLGGVIASYGLFLARFRPLLALLDEGRGPSPVQAFVLRTLLIHAYRRIQLHDPQLPVELLPEPWPGAHAYELARDLYLRVQEAAETYVMATLRREDDGAAPADALYYRRFGGLT